MAHVFLIGLFVCHAYELSAFAAHKAILYGQCDFSYLACGVAGIDEEYTAVAGIVNCFACGAVVVAVYDDIEARYLACNFLAGVLAASWQRDSPLASRMKESDDYVWLFCFFNVVRPLLCCGSRCCYEFQC